jgi:DNA polymerase/3'-5' exonuclease PolX
MSNRPKFPLAKALNVAQELRQALASHCERIEIAGSIRRRKPMVGDIEILFVPKMGTQGSAFLFPDEHSQVDDAVEHLAFVNVLAQRPSKTGLFTWGSQNKLAIHVASGIPVDLFATTASGWWRSLVIRTGPKELNIRLIQSAKGRGILVHAYREPALENAATGDAIPCNSEREFFEICGVPYLEPWQRK